jgi:hypothetical protein
MTPRVKPEARFSGKAADGPAIQVQGGLFPDHARIYPLLVTPS